MSEKFQVAHLRLKDGMGNRASLLVYVKPDGFFSYQLISGWNPSGDPKCLSSLGDDVVLPAVPSSRGAPSAIGLISSKVEGGNYEVTTPIVSPEAEAYLGSLKSG